MQKALNLAEYALAERESLKDSGVLTALGADLRCCAAGLLLMTELGARTIEAIEGDRVAVEVGGDAIVGWRMVEHHVDLLRRLGWAPYEGHERASYQPLLMVYVR